MIVDLHGAERLEARREFKFSKLKFSAEGLVRDHCLSENTSVFSRVAQRFAASRKGNALVAQEDHGQIHRCASDCPRAPHAAF